MKATILAVTVAIVMMVALAYRDSAPVTYVKETIEVVEEPKEAWMLDEEAIQAAKDVIKKKELQAELVSLKELQASTTAKIKSVQAELDSY